MTQGSTPTESSPSTSRVSASTRSSACSRAGSEKGQPAEQVPLDDSCPQDRAWQARVEAMLGVTEDKSGQRRRNLMPLSTSLPHHEASTELPRPASSLPREVARSTHEELEWDMLDELARWTDDDVLREQRPTANDQALVRAAMSHAEAGLRVLPRLDENGRNGSAGTELHTPRIPSQLGRYAVAGLLLLVGAAGAASSIVDANDAAQGRGLPEDPSRVLIVGSHVQQERHRDLARWLTKQVVVADDLARPERSAVRYFKPETAIKSHAIAAGRQLNPELDGIEAILEWADEQGFGYVAFEGDDPNAPSWDNSTSPAQRTSAVVFPVGPLATDASASSASVYPGIDHRGPAGLRVAMMRALARQPLLARLRAGSRRMSDARGAKTSPKVLFDTGLNFRRRQWELSNYAELAANTIKAWPQLEELVEAGPKSEVRLLSQPLRYESWLPLATGSSLVVSSPLSWTSVNGRVASLRPTSVGQLQFAQASARKPGLRNSCGGLPTQGVAEGRMSRDGSALTLAMSDGSRESFALQTDQAGACSFVSVSQISADMVAEISADDEVPLGEARPSGKTAVIDRFGQLWLRGKRGTFKAVATGHRFIGQGQVQWLSDHELAVPLATAASQRLGSGAGLAYIDLRPLRFGREARVRSWSAEQLLDTPGYTISDQFTIVRPGEHKRRVIVQAVGPKGDRLVALTLDFRAREHKRWSRRARKQGIRAHTSHHQIIERVDIWQNPRRELSSIQVSPTGKSLAFITHPSTGGSSTLHHVQLFKRQQLDLSRVQTLARTGGQMFELQFDGSGRNLSFRTRVDAFGARQFPVYSAKIHSP